ncbi:MAG: hypothetical protein WA634_11030 [Silvibacterium sp.]
MNTAPPIPADQLLAHVISALIVADAATLRQLESAAPSVTAPHSRVQYIHKHAVFSALLEASARNLRLLGRAAGKRDANLYVSGRQ